MDESERKFDPEQKKIEQIARITNAVAKLDAFIAQLPDHHSLQTDRSSHGREFKSLLDSIKHTLDLSVKRIEVETEQRPLLHMTADEAEQAVDHFIALYNLLVEKV